MNYYEKWDSIVSECNLIHSKQFSQFENIKKLRDSVVKSVTATSGNGLGIASPSKFTKYYIGKYKTGKIIKNPKPGQLYTVNHYDKNNDPLIIDLYDVYTGESNYCQLGFSTYFCNYDNITWTAKFSSDGKLLFKDHYKIIFDSQHRLCGFYEAYADSQIVFAEEYDYSDVESGILYCLYTRYTGGKFNTSKDIPVGFDGSPAEEYKFVIGIDNKGKYQSIKQYVNTEGEFVFKNTIL